jgi:hypothetical protein
VHGCLRDTADARMPTARRSPIDQIHYIVVSLEEWFNR